MAAMAELNEYGTRLLEAKRRDRGDDVFSDLLTAQECRPESFSDPT